MNYKKHYNLLIARARNRLLEEYTEQHHIFPRCMGGEDELDNLVMLTGREHYVAHQLLIKIYPDEHKLVFAAKMMISSNHRIKRSKNRIYGWLKKRHAIAQSAAMMGNTYGSANKGRLAWNSGIKTGPESIETRQKKSLALKGNTNAANGKGTKKGPQSKEHKHKLALIAQKPLTINEQYYSSRKEAAEILGVDVSTIYTWLGNGKAQNLKNRIYNVN